MIRQDSTPAKPDQGVLAGAINTFETQQLQFLQDQMVGDPGILRQAERNQHRQSRGSNTNDSSSPAPKMKWPPTPTDD